jgi:hypothetical protein
MSSYWLGEMFEDDSEDTCKISAIVDGGLSGGSCVKTWEQGPPSALENSSSFKIPEGVVVGFQIFAWAPKKHKY